MPRPKLPEGLRRRSHSLTLAPETLHGLLAIQAEANGVQQAWSLSQIVDSAVKIAYAELLSQALGSGEVVLHYGPKTARDLGFESP